MSWREEADKLDEGVGGDLYSAPTDDYGLSKMLTQPKDDDYDDWRKGAADLDSWRNPTATTSTSMWPELNALKEYERDAQTDQAAIGLSSEIMSDRLGHETDKCAAKVSELGKLVDGVLGAGRKGSSLLDPKFDEKMAAYDNELEAQSEIERRRLNELTDQERAAEQAKQDFYISCQTRNTLGMLNLSSGVEPKVKLEIKQLLDSIGENPDVHDSSALYNNQSPIADTSFWLDSWRWPTQADFEPRAKYARCDTCFDPIQPNTTKGFSGRACRDKKHRFIYHSECFYKVAASPCSYCGVPLVADTERNLSGKWGVHESKNYHVECYQLFAGPRCHVCFDVIFANLKTNKSGQWIKKDSGELLHQECYQELLARVEEETDTSPDSRQDTHATLIAEEKAANTKAIANTNKSKQASGKSKPEKDDDVPPPYKR
eukprot:m.34156 g.34156  ORF g.34156 m.34156 type:complete len:431 (+) comp16938_c0_seq1:320-1612(+)